MQIKWRAVVKGFLTFLPVLDRLGNRTTGGTASARYCYSVWMRHLYSVSAVRGVFRPHCVAELGPGDSLGIGLSAILSGVDSYYALDRKEHAFLKTNLSVLDELVELFRNRASIPDDAEFPGVFPKLDCYEFPHKLLNEEWLDYCLAPERLASIKRLLSGSSLPNEPITLRYFAPWDENAAIRPESVDWVFSQAVLEHVDEPKNAYQNLWKWLKPNGLMSHTIDYGSHGLAKKWDGHRTVGDFLWNIVRGRRPYLINRLSHSAHIEMMNACRFEILAEFRIADSYLSRRLLAPRFRNLTALDLSTRSAFVVAFKFP